MNLEEASRLREKSFFFLLSNFIFNFLSACEKWEISSAGFGYTIQLYMCGCTPPKNKLNGSRRLGKIISVINKCMRAQESLVSRARKL